MADNLVEKTKSELLVEATLEAQQNMYQFNLHRSIVEREIRGAYDKVYGASKTD